MSKPQFVNLKQAQQFFVKKWNQSLDPIVQQLSLEFVSLYDGQRIWNHCIKNKLKFADFIAKVLPEKANGVNINKGFVKMMCSLGFLIDKYIYG